MLDTIAVHGIFSNYGVVAVSVDADIDGPFAIHPHLDGDDGELNETGKWTVTHVATGWMLRHFSDKWRAYLYASLMQGAVAELFTPKVEIDRNGHEYTAYDVNPEFKAAHKEAVRIVTSLWSER